MFGYAAACFVSLCVVSSIRMSLRVVSSIRSESRFTELALASKEMHASVADPSAQGAGEEAKAALAKLNEMAFVFKQLQARMALREQTRSEMDYYGQKVAGMRAVHAAAPQVPREVERLARNERKVRIPSRAR